MLKYQMGLIALLIGCFVFISCDVVQELLTLPMPEEDVVPPDDMMPTDDTMVTDDMVTDDTMMTDDGTMVTDDGTMVTDDTTTDDTMMTDDTAADYTSWLSVSYAAISPAHGQGDRIVYINDIGAMALQDESMTAFPVGTVVVKDIMDVTNTSVEKTERMEKTDDAMYATENGWLYNEGATQAGCHGCHVAAGTGGAPGIDSVFTIQFPMPDVAGEGQ